MRPKPTARELGLSTTSTVRDYLLRCGGIRPVPRHRAVPVGFELEEREEISRGLAAGLSLRAIAVGLGRAAVNGEPGGHRQRRPSRAIGRRRADKQAWITSRRRPKPCKLADEPVLRDIVTEKLKTSWSPQQIAGWLKLTYPDDPEMQVSHESIYRTLFVQSRGALRKELTAYLRTGRVIRRPRAPAARRSRLPARDPEHLRTTR